MDDLDLDDELLMLAGSGGGGSKNSKKKAKRRRIEMDSSESDMEMSSGSEAAPPMAADSDDEAATGATPSNPFPYQGLYFDAEDKRRIQAMSELEREAVLGERQEQLQELKDREHLRGMVARKDDQADGKRASGRDKARPGVTSEKSRKLNELKEKRQAKGVKRARTRGEDEHANKPGHRHLASDDDWGSDEDGEIDVVEEQRLKREKGAKKSDVATQDELRAVQLTRKRAVELCCTKFFDEYAKGCWVRLMVPDKRGGNKYLIGEITRVEPSSKYYEVDGVATNAGIYIRIGGKPTKHVLHPLSNSFMSDREIEEMGAAAQRYGQPLPSRKAVLEKAKYLEKYRNWIKEDADVTAQIKAKKILRQQSQGSSRLSLTEKMHLDAEQEQATASRNSILASKLSKQPGSTENGLSRADTLAAVNERNRKANREEIRRAELAAAEERKRQLKAIEAGQEVKLDPSARVRINPKLTYDKTSSGSNSRAMTPQLSQPQANGGNPLPNLNIPQAPKPSLSDQVASQLVIDLGDF